MFCIIGKKDVPLYETNLGIIKVYYNGLDKS